MSSEKLKQSWIRVRISDSKHADLRCEVDKDDKPVHIYDYDGNELKFNVGARYVMWRGERWKF